MSSEGEDETSNSVEMNSTTDPPKTNAVEVRKQPHSRWWQLHHHLKRFGDQFRIKTEQAFEWWGTMVARRPWLFILLGFLIAGLCSLGLIAARSVSEPEKLWSDKNSRFSQEKKFFDENFGPFYRINTVLVLGKQDGEDVLQTK